MSLPAYPLELKTAPDGNVYMRLEKGWAWAGRKRSGAWTHVNGRYELLLARQLLDDGRVEQLRPSYLAEEPPTIEDLLAAAEAEHGRPFFAPL